MIAMPTPTEPNLFQVKARVVDHAVDEMRSVRRPPPTDRPEFDQDSPLARPDVVVLSEREPPDAPIRSALVARVRRMIADGEYLTEARLERTIERLHNALRPTAEFEFAAAIP